MRCSRTGVVANLVGIRWRGTPTRLHASPLVSFLRSDHFEWLDTRGATWPGGPARSGFVERGLGQALGLRGLRHGDRDRRRHRPQLADRRQQRALPGGSASASPATASAAAAIIPSLIPRAPARPRHPSPSPGNISALLACAIPVPHARRLTGGERASRRHQCPAVGPGEPGRRASPPPSTSGWTAA